MANGAISITAILKSLQHRWAFLFFMMIVGMTISALITFLLISPKYEAETQLLVNKTVSEMDGNTFQDIQTDLQLMNTYIAIVKSDAILKDSIEQLELTWNLEKLQNALSVSSEENSKVLNINVRGEDPIMVTNITNKIAEVFSQKIVKMLDIHSVETLTEATFIETNDKVSPNTFLNLFIGSFIGLIMGIALVILRDYFDKTFKSEEEVEQYLNVPVIGVVHKINRRKQSKIKPVVTRDKMEGKERG